MRFDQTDFGILEKLQENSKKKAVDISKELGIVNSTVFNRIKRLEENGVIVRYKAIVDPKKLGRKVTAIVQIATEKLSAFEIAQKLREKPLVEEVYVVSGEFDIIAKVRFEDDEEVGKFIFDPKTGLKTWQGVQKTETMFVLKEFKEHGTIMPARSSQKPKK